MCHTVAVVGVRASSLWGAGLSQPADGPTDTQSGSFGGCECQEPALHKGRLQTCQVLPYREVSHMTSSQVDPSVGFLCSSVPITVAPPRHSIWISVTASAPGFSGLPSPEGPGGAAPPALRQAGPCCLL